MDFSLKFKQEIKLILTQEMKLSMNILKMSASKLKDYLEREAVNNPAIEITYNNTPNRASSEDSFSPLDFVSEEETLIDYLEEQISYLKLAPKIREICIFIINNLDNRGYLATAKLEIKKFLNINVKQLNEAFEIIYTLDPIGVGAENLQDCLKIQLRKKEIYDEKLFFMIDNFLEEIAGQNYLYLEEKLKISKEKIIEYIDEIKRLSPIPARGYVVHTRNTYIIPEARIEIKENELIFKINEERIPKININSLYSQNSEANKYFINRAINIIKSLEKRYQTLNRILEVLITKQKDFFFKGENFLQTLTLKDVAIELNLHESTISRAIKEKYLDTPQGIISMKSLFIIDSKTIKIKKILEELINSENKNYPLSDESLSLHLKKRGYIVARRTVAKYREELGFESIRKRKKRL